MGSERRLYPRLDVDIGARMVLEGSAETLVVRVSNLSVTGAAVESEAGPDPGGRISSLVFELPSVNAGSGEAETVSIDLAATVSRRITVAPQPGEEPGYILGLEFQGLEEPVRRLIHRFVFQRIMDKNATKVAKSAKSAESAPKRIKRVPYRQPITLSYDWFGEFETQLTENLSVDGMFIRSARPYPPGTVFDFQLLLRDDFTLVKGRGEVVWIREREGSPTQPAGMGIRFLDLDDTGRKVIHRVVAHHLEEESGVSGANDPGNAETPTVLHQRPQDVPLVPVAVSDAESTDDRQKDIEASMPERMPGDDESNDDMRLHRSRQLLDELLPEEPSPYTKLVDSLETSTEESDGTVEHLQDRIARLEAQLSKYEAPADEPESDESPDLRETSAEPDDPIPTEETQPFIGNDPSEEPEEDLELLEDPPLPTPVDGDLLPTPTDTETTFDSIASVATGPVVSPALIEYRAASLRHRARWPWLLLVSVVLIAALATWAYLQGFLGVPQWAAPAPTVEAETVEAETAEPEVTPPPEESTASDVTVEPEPPEEAAPPPEETAIAFVRVWAAAWAAQRTDEYLTFYSPEFELPGGLTRGEWEDFRRSRVETPEFIRIDVRDIEVVLGASGLAEVTFFQTYTRPGFSDQSRKQLVLAPTGDGWRITSERTVS